MKQMQPKHKKYTVRGRAKAATRKVRELAVVGRALASTRHVVMAQIVPMRFFNLTLTAPEAEAYNASFLEEKSLRADVARTLIRLVSCVARVNTELEELKRSQSMSSLWKLHADALVVLLDIASTTAEEAAGIAKAAESKDDAASAKAIRETVQKLRDRSDLAVKALAHPGS